MSEYKPPAQSAGAKDDGWLKKGLMGCGLLLGLLVLGAFGVVLFFGLFAGAEGGVRLSNEMEAYAVEYLEEHHLLDADEVLIAYYDETLDLDGTEAIILTKDRILHHRAKTQDTSIALAQIESWNHHEEGMIGDVFQIEAKDGRLMRLEIAPFNEGGTFKLALEKQLARLTGVE